MRRFQEPSGAPELKHIDAGWDDDASIDARWDEGAANIDAGWDEVAETTAKDAARVESLQPPPHPISEPGQAASPPAEPRLVAEASSDATSIALAPTPIISAELTPVPMVVCDRAHSDNESARDAKAAVSSVSIAVNEDVIWRGTSAITVGGFSWRRDVLPTGAECESDPASQKDEHAEGVDTSHAEYHPPQPPPSSAAPAEAEPSVCVAADFDPKAPTQPKLPRAARVTSPPLLFGLDRMLVWGLVLGGLFVAIIVVIVNQVALIRPRRGTAEAPLSASGVVSSSASPKAVGPVRAGAQTLPPEAAKSAPAQHSLVKVQSQHPTLEPDAGAPLHTKPKKTARVRSSSPPVPSFSPTRPILGTD